MLRRMSDAAPGALEIVVNGEPYVLAAHDTVATLILTLGLGEQRVAVAVNREVVPRSEFPKRALGNGDRVEILRAVGGGA